MGRRSSVSNNAPWAAPPPPLFVVSMEFRDDMNQQGSLSFAPAYDEWLRARLVFSSIVLLKICFGTKSCDARVRS